MVGVDREWIGLLKVGDTVYVSSDYGNPPSKVTVSRITNTQIITQSGRFRKEDGWSIRSGNWNRQFLMKPSSAIEQRVRISLLKGKAITLKGQLTIPDDEPTLLALIEALEKFVKEDSHGTTL